MNPKIRALVWEELRVAGIASLWCLVVAALLYVGFDLSPYVTEASDYLVFHYLVFLFGGVVFLFRQNAEGNLIVGFERRLARLPLDNASLAIVPLAVRCVSYAAYGAGLLLILRFHIGYFQPVCMLLFPVVLYAFVQAAFWSGSTLLSVGLAAAGAAAWVLFQLLVAPHVTLEPLVDGSMEPQGDALYVSLLAVLLAAAFGLSRLSVRWQRSRSQPALSIFPGARAKEVLHPDSRTPDFKSPLDARVWFDQRSIMVRLLPVLIVGVGVAAPLAMLVYFGQTRIYGLYRSPYALPDIPADVLRWFPFLVVICVAAGIGQVYETSGSTWKVRLGGFNRTKPLGAASLAWVYLLVMTRILSVALLLVFILSNVLYALLFPGELQVMAASARVGGLFRAFIFYIEPLFWACVLSWLALTCLRPVFWGALVVGTIGIVVSLAFGIDIFTKEGEIPFFVIFHCLFLALILRSVWLACRCWRAQILSRQFCILFLGGHVALTAFIWWPGPLDLDVAAHSLFLTFSFVTLLLSPFVALPYRVARKRVIL